MQVFKKHIALALLVGFLFPQVVTGMHYLVISHGFTSETQFAFKKSSFDFTYHSCVYHLNGITGLLPFGSFFEISKDPAPLASFSFCSLENYVHQPDYNFQLRGPPLLHAL